MRYNGFTVLGHRWTPSMEGAKIATNPERPDVPSVVAAWTCPDFPGLGITTHKTVTDFMAATACDAYTLTHLPSGLAFMGGIRKAKDAAELADTLAYETGWQVFTLPAERMKPLGEHPKFHLVMERARGRQYGRLVTERPAPMVLRTGWLPTKEWRERLGDIKAETVVRVERPDGRAVEFMAESKVGAHVGAMLKLNPEAWVSLDVREFIPMEGRAETVRRNDKIVNVVYPRPSSGPMCAVLDMVAPGGFRAQVILWQSEELRPLVQVPCAGGEASEASEAVA